MIQFEQSIKVKSKSPQGGLIKIRMGYFNQKIKIKVQIPQEELQE